MARQWARRLWCFSNAFFVSRKIVPNLFVTVRIVKYGQNPCSPRLFLEQLFPEHPYSEKNNLGMSNSCLVSSRWPWHQHPSNGLGHAHTYIMLSASERTEHPAPGQDWNCDWVVPKPSSQGIFGTFITLVKEAPSQQPPPALLLQECSSVGVE